MVYQYQKQRGPIFDPSQPDFKKKVLVVVGLVLIALTLIVVLSSLFGASSDEQKTQDVKETKVLAVLYLDSLANKDIAEAKALSSSTSIVQKNDRNSFNALIDLQEINYGACNVSEVRDVETDLALAIAQCDGKKLNVTMVKQSDEWKVQLIT
jgi:hypothetical protein